MNTNNNKKNENIEAKGKLSDKANKRRLNLIIFSTLPTENSINRCQFCVKVCKLSCTPKLNAKQRKR